MPEGADRCPACESLREGHLEGLLPEGHPLRGGSYRIARPIARSRSSALYLADTPDQGQVVVKELFPGFALRNAQTQEVLTFHASVEDRERFDRHRRALLRDGERLKGVEQESVASILEAFEENGTAYLVTEHVPGAPLSLELRRRGRLEGEEVAEIAERALGGLEAIHEAGVIHQGLTPDALVQRPDGWVVLVGFGADPEAEPDGYRPPERSSSASEATAAADLYSLGVTLVELLTGQGPEVGRNSWNPSQQEGLGEHFPDLPVAWTEALAPVLSSDPKRRPKHAAALREHLRLCLERSSRPPERPAPADPPASQEAFYFFCTTCNVRYSIPRDEVVGKTFKVRCKKCQSPIVVQGPSTRKKPSDDSGAAEDDGWWVVIKAKKVGPLTVNELVERARRGELGHNTYCWRSGMDNWVRLRRIDRLTEALRAVEPPRKEPPPKPKKAEKKPQASPSEARREPPPKAGRPQSKADTPYGEGSQRFSLENLGSLTFRPADVEEAEAAEEVSSVLQALSPASEAKKLPKEDELDRLTDIKALLERNPHWREAKPKATSRRDETLEHLRGVVLPSAIAGSPFVLVEDEEERPKTPTAVIVVGVVFLIALIFIVGLSAHLLMERRHPVEETPTEQR